MNDDKFEENSYAQMLVEAGADVNSICSPASDTILHLLAGEAREEAGLFLVSSGANVNKVTMMIYSLSSYILYTIKYIRSPEFSFVAFSLFPTFNPFLQA